MGVGCSAQLKEDPLTLWTELSHGYACQFKTMTLKNIFFFWSCFSKLHMFSWIMVVHILYSLLIFEKFIYCAKMFFLLISITKAFHLDSNNTVHISPKDEYQQMSNDLVLSLEERYSKVERWWKAQEWGKEKRKPRDKRKRKTDRDGRNRSRRDERARLSQSGSWPGTHNIDTAGPCP